jgi:probable HAF family extracellular repeat protein
MRLLSWLRDLTGDIEHARAGRTRRHTTRGKAAAVRVHLEPLEDRCCPTAGYTVTDLGTLGGAYSYAYAINNATASHPAQVVGEADTASRAGHAFLYSGGVMTDLGTLSADTYSIATALNSSGQVVGTSNYWSSGTTTHHAFLWQASTGMTDLGNLGASETSALAVNDPTTAHPFQVVGYGEITACGVDHAWLWQNGVMTDLNTLIPSNSGWVLTSANGINDNEQIVGQGTINGQYHTFLWQVGNGAPTDLGVLPGGNMSQANAINSNGQVAGTSFIAMGGTCRAFSWTSPGPMTNLGILPKDFQSEALALNNLAEVQVVGFSESLGAYDRAVLWQSGKVIDLNNQLPKNSGWFVQRADGVNDVGWIVGEGGNGSGPHAILLTPISGNAPMAAALTSLGNVGITAADLGGRPLGVADETIHGANGQAAFNDAAVTSSWVRYVEQTRHNDAQMANTRERLVQRTFETDDADEWSSILDAMMVSVRWRGVLQTRVHWSLAHP